MGPHRVDAADGAVQGQQEEQTHQQLGALDDVRDALRLQRVHRPEQRHRHREPRCLVAVASSQARGQERSPDDAEEQERTQQVYGQVEGVVAPDVEPSECVVDRQREVHDRPACHGARDGRGR